MTVPHPEIPRIHTALSDVAHEIGVALLYDDGQYAYGVFHGATGEVIAWDGWYSDEDHQGMPADVKPITGSDWDEWEDMPTKLLIQSQSEWANARMAFFLIPSFSPAQEAARLVTSQLLNKTGNLAASRILNSKVLAYLPISDTDVYDDSMS